MNFFKNLIAYGAVLLHRMAGHIPLANLITAARYTSGLKPITANELVLRHALVKFDSTELTALNCTTAAIPLGIARAELAAGDIGNIAILGAAPGTEIAIADAAIARDAFIVPAVTAGRARTLPVTTGTYYVFGRAITAAGAATDEFEFAPCVPYKVVVP